MSLPVLSPDSNALSAEQRRTGIEALQARIEADVASGELTAKIKGGEEECEHIFGGGMYARGLLIPAGELVIGRLHKQERIVVIASGSCVFVDEDRRREVCAPWFGSFEKGSKTAVYAKTDCYWVAIFKTDLEDSKTAFDQLSCATRAEYVAYLKLQEKI